MPPPSPSARSGQCRSPITRRPHLVDLRGGNRRGKGGGCGCPSPCAVDGNGDRDGDAPARGWGPLRTGKEERKKVTRARDQMWGGWTAETCARVGADARVWPDAVAYILCECDLSHQIGDGRLKNVRPFGLNGPFSFLWLLEPILQILHLFFLMI
jgi:hypothetical protein